MRWSLRPLLLTVLAACAQKTPAPTIRPAGMAPAQKTWSGSWKGPAGTGNVVVTVMEYTGAAYVTYDVEGDPLGCGRRLNGSLYLEDGVDVTRHGLSLSQPDPILGAIDLVAHGKRVRGGSTAPCAGVAPDWTTATKVRRKLVSGKLLLHPQAAAVEKTNFHVKVCPGCPPASVNPG